MTTLNEHTKEIYTIEWAPCGTTHIEHLKYVFLLNFFCFCFLFVSIGPGTRNPGAKPLLASASFDSTVKVKKNKKSKQ